jgi:hypothetical protein
MPHYYFDIRDGDELAPDEEGLHLKSTEAARAEAAKSLADMVRDAAHYARPANRRQMAIEVRDNAGPVMRVKLVFEIEGTKK